MSRRERAVRTKRARQAATQRRCMLLSSSSCKQYPAEVTQLPSGRVSDICVRPPPPAKASGVWITSTYTALALPAVRRRVLQLPASTGHRLAPSGKAFVVVPGLVAGPVCHPGCSPPVPWPLNQVCPGARPLGRQSAAVLRPPGVSVPPCACRFRFRRLLPAPVVVG